MILVEPKCYVSPAAVSGAVAAGSGRAASVRALAAAARAERGILGCLRGIGRIGRAVGVAALAAATADRVVVHCEQLSDVVLGHGRLERRGLPDVDTRLGGEPAQFVIDHLAGHR